MSKETNAIIKYEGKEITIFSDERNEYVNLTEMANAFGQRKLIKDWINTKQTIDFLIAWEKKHNSKFTGGHLPPSIELKKSKRKLSIQDWIESTNAIGLFSRVRGANPGTWAHKDIAIRFGGWLSPDFELWLVEEIQRLKEIEKKKYSLELLTHQQILDLIRLKEVFKYVAHQEMVEDANKEVFAAQSASKQPFAAFNKWRNEMLDLTPSQIDERLREYCRAKNIPLTTRILNKTKREKILFYDSYESVRNAVWDFLSINGDINAKNLADLVSNMLRIEGAEILRENKTDLFHTKQDLGEYDDMEKVLGEMYMVKSARQVLALRARTQKNKIGEQNQYDKYLTGLLNTPPPKKGKK